MNEDTNPITPDMETGTPATPIAVPAGGLTNRQTEKTFVPNPPEQAAAGPSAVLEKPAAAAQNPGNLTLEAPRGMPSPPPPSPQPRAGEPGIAPLRTLKGDIASAIQHQNISLAGIALREAQKRRSQITTEKRTSATKVVLVTLSILLVIGAVAAAAYFYISSRPTDSGPKETTPVSSFSITTDSQSQFDIQDYSVESLRRRLSLFVASENLRIATIQKVELVKTVSENSAEYLQRVSTDEFFERIGTLAPERLLRFLSNNFLFGIHAFKKNTAFLLFSTDSYQGAFSEILAWERTLADDLYLILAGGPAKVELSGREWQDKVIKNIDTRVLYDDEGNIIMIYSFLGSRDTLFIGADQNTFEEVLLRFQTPRQVTQ